MYLPVYTLQGIDTNLDFVKQQRAKVLAAFKDVCKRLGSGTGIECVYSNPVSFICAVTNDKWEEYYSFYRKLT